MRNKVLLWIAAIIIAIIATIAYGVAVSTTVYAGNGEKDGHINGQYDIDLALIPIVVPETEEIAEPVSRLETESRTFTPPGNLTLVDDFSDEQGEDKQFITVTTQNGHYFYIIIDRAGSRNNVHFLSKVSEYDLWAIIEDEVRQPIAPAPIEILPESAPEPEPEQQNNNSGGLVVTFLLVGLIGGGAYYYFKILKPKQNAKNTAISELDEFVFDGNENDIILDEDIPDFTLTDEPEEFSFESAETQESEGKE